jgi:acyl carrier protein
MDTTTLIRGFLKDHHDIDLAPETLTAEARLEDLGVDSLALLELMFDFEETYKASFPRSSTTPRTVGELVALIEGLQRTSAPA